MKDHEAPKLQDVGGKIRSYGVGADSVDSVANCSPLVQNHVLGWIQGVLFEVSAQFG